jgi:uncharacterized protein (DUF2062 family)
MKKKRLNRQSVHHFLWELLCTDPMAFDDISNGTIGAVIGGLFMGVFVACCTVLIVRVYRKRKTRQEQTRRMPNANG